MIPMASKTKQLRIVALASYMGLLTWVVLWHFVLTTTHEYSVTFTLLVYVLPLLLPFKGIVQAKPYTHAWANFIILFYIIHGITVLYAVPLERSFALVELILASCMFTGCSLFARFRGKELGLGLKKQK